MRQKIIAGNWKMNKNINEAGILASELVEKAGSGKVAEIVLCPPYLAVSKVAEVIRGPGCSLGR